MNLDIIDIMLPAFVECLVLVGIHSYLGLHVIKRKVIFVDLSLAQIAALGTTVAFLFGIDPNATGAYWFSLGFTIIGAAIFSLSRLRHEKIPQEAIIGLVYALAAAVAILVIDKSPHGSEHIKEIMTGSILWVKWKTILAAAIIYAFVGLFHYIFREKFILISNKPEVAYKRGMNVRLWDFLFYISFGIVITHSVRTAGVLLVFVFLVVPAVATIMITNKMWLQLLLGWTMGTLVSMIGLFISYIADIPSGPTVVATYGLALLILSLVLYVIRAPRREKALLNIAMGLGALFLTLLLFYGMGKYFHDYDSHNSEIEIFEHVDASESLPTFEKQLDEETNNGATSASDKQALILSLEQSGDQFRKLEILKKLVRLDEKTGTQHLIQFLEQCEIPFLCEEAVNELKKYSGSDFGYDSLKNKPENLPAIKQFRNWWEQKYR